MKRIFFFTIIFLSLSLSCFSNVTKKVYLWNDGKVVNWYFLSDIDSLTFTVQSPVFDSLNVVDIYSNRVSFEAYISSAIKLDTCGVMISTSAISDSISLDSCVYLSRMDDTRYNAQFNGLQPSTTYHYRGFIIQENDTVYSADNLFATSDYTPPVVSLDPITTVFYTTAVVTASVVSDSILVACGFYYSTDSTLQTYDSIPANSISESFRVTISGLQSDSTYYVAAYVRVQGDNQTYKSDVKSFVTDKWAAFEAVQVQGTSSLISFNCSTSIVTEYAISEKGFCISTLPSPDILDTLYVSDVVSHSFSTLINGLTPGTTYYVRPYAVSSYYGVVYGEEFSVTTPSLPLTPQGAISGLFSISDTSQVFISQGSLQYQPSTNLWRFAENQYDMIGIGDSTNTTYLIYVAGNVPNSANYSISNAAYTGWIDLFGWGSGTYPTRTSSDKYQWADFHNWGNNPIDNANAADTTRWRAFSKDEFQYLIQSRPNASQKFGLAKVNGITGFILLPDIWSCPEGLTFRSGLSTGWGWFLYERVNNFTAEQWELMQQNGAVFFPSLGARSLSNVTLVGEKCYYWTSSTESRTLATYFYVDSKSYKFDNEYRYYGYGVRLCQNANDIPSVDD